MNFAHPFFPRKLGTAFIYSIFLLSPLAAFADDYADVAQLAKNGKYSEALQKADQFLAQKPRDPQMRFIKGVVQRDSGKTSDAINTFTRLTEDYPELPEPYNNLAVLYAGDGQYDKARKALEMAIRTNPSYATAHENLGDVYAKLASQAYNKALQLDANNTVVPPKLALIRELFTPAVGSKPRAAPAPSSSAPVAVANTASAAVTNKAPPSLPTQAGTGLGADKKPVAVLPTPAPTASTANTANQPSSTAPAAAPAPTASTAKAAAPDAEKATVKADKADKSEKDVEAAIRAWARAWSNKEMRAYFNAYSRDFDPPSSMSRRSWEEDRTQKITSKKNISVKVEGIRITVNGNRATAKFRQDYKAGGLAVSSSKTLDMTKNGDRWLIVRESVN